MGYFPSELEWAPEVIGADGVSRQLERHAGRGYPTGEPGTAYWPGSPLPADTVNPHGVPNAPDEFPPLEVVEEAHPVQNHRYVFKTWEQRQDFVGSGPPSPVWDNDEVGFEFDFSRLDLLYQWHDNMDIHVIDNGQRICVGRAVPLGVGGGEDAWQDGPDTRPRWYPPGYLWNDGGGQLLDTAFKAPAAGTLVAKVKGRGAHSGTKWIISGANKSALAANINGFLCGVVGDDNETVILGPDINGLVGIAALSWDGTTVKLYWNGAVVYSGPQNGATLAENYLISQSNNSEVYRVLAINRVLTPEEIAAFNAAWEGPTT